MQVLDARHIELFLTEEYQKGSWEYKLVGSHDVRKSVDSASGGIFDIKYLKSSSTAGKCCPFPTRSKVKLGTKETVQISHTRHELFL